MTPKLLFPVFCLFVSSAFALSEPPRKALAPSQAEASIALPGDGKDWEKVDEDDGLTIYEKKDETGFLAFRAEGVIDGSVRDVASAILDADHTTDWVDHLEEDRVLSRPGPGKFIEYTHIGTPFVLKDRDFVCEVNVKADEKAKVLSIESHSVDDPGAPRTKYVRGSVVHNEFRLSPDGSPNRTLLRGEFHIDPKGTVPKWIVNLFQRAWPRKAFLAIQKRVKEHKSTLPLALEPAVAPVARF